MLFACEPVTTSRLAPDRNIGVKSSAADSHVAATFRVNLNQDVTQLYAVMPGALGPREALKPLNPKIQDLPRTVRPGQDAFSICNLRRAPAGLEAALFTLPSRADKSPGGRTLHFADQGRH
eukprot:1187281-Prorocentrum_minimum.AAC.1